MQKLVHSLVAPGANGCTGTMQCRDTAINLVVIRTSQNALFALKAEEMPEAQGYMTHVS